jgi:type II secretory pathway pseudopilin PulG
MFGKVFSGGMALATNMQAAEKDLVAIRSAILSYDSANGQYPNTLTELVPKYLPDASELHSALDANPSPTHVSFTYAKPTSNATSTSPLVDIAFVPDLGVTAPNTPTPQMSTSQWFLSITVGGQLVQATYVNGKLNSRQNIPTPPGQP